MSEQDKAAQRSTLILQLGHVLRTIRDLVDKTSPPTATDYRVAAARFQPDWDRWMNEVSKFVFIGSYRFAQPYDEVAYGMRCLWNCLGQLANATSADGAAQQKELREHLRRLQADILAAIDKVPIEWGPQLLAAQTPFSVYLKLRDAIGTAKKRVHFFDRYLDVSFFELYMRDLSRSLEIRLVTTAGKTSFGVTNVIAVSRLAAAEFTNYQLIECNATDMHDRNLRLDDQIFFLGPSAKDAGDHPTNFALTDSSRAAHAILDGLIAKGTVKT